ncbi:MAG: hypothetical protein Q4C46_06980 [Bacillota bacterium]|nr:hypothetical protein [Bacillota bacterium]
MLIGGVVVLTYVVIIIIGLCLVVAMPDMENPDLAFATATTTFTPTGVRGVLLAAALASVMSTASSEIMGTATVAYNDLVCASKPDMSEKQGIRITRIIAVIVGCLAIVCALWIQSVLVALDVAYAFISGCIFIPLVFAFIMKKVKGGAAVTGMQLRNSTGISYQRRSHSNNTYYVRNPCERSCVLPCECNR